MSNCIAFCSCSQCAFPTLLNLLLAHLNMAHVSSFASPSTASATEISFLQTNGKFPNNRHAVILASLTRSYHMKSIGTIFLDWNTEREHISLWRVVSPKWRIKESAGRYMLIHFLDREMSFKKQIWKCSQPHDGLFYMVGWSWHTNWNSTVQSFVQSKTVTGYSEVYTPIDHRIKTCLEGFILSYRRDDRQSIALCE